MKILIVLPIFIALTYTSQALTTSGVISGEEIWSGEVVLTGDVTVNAAGKLTIMPGTTVKAQPKTDDRKGGEDSSRIELIIDGGEIVASGTESRCITFTSAGDKPEKDDWYGIRFLKGIGTIKYWDQSFGKKGILIQVPILGGVEYCSFSDNSETGAHAKSLVTFTECKFDRNTWGLWFDNGIRLEKCAANSNSKAGIGGNGEGRITQCTTIGNSEGISMYGSKKTNSLIANNCTINGNTSYGIYVVDSWIKNTVRISRTTIIGNGAGVRLYKYLDKINFIFISVARNNHLDIFHKIIPSLVCPPLYPLVFHKTPEDLNKIQLWRRLGQIEYLQILAFPFWYLCLNCSTGVVTRVIHHNHCLSGEITYKGVKESDNYITINIFLCSVSH